MGRKRRGGPSGVLVVDKPAGITSFDVVRQVRRLLQAGKVGHTGTLDPMATGVLPVCVGEATKVAGLLTADDKEYVGTGQLGLETDTLDTTGEVTGRHDPGGVDQESLERVLATFHGRQLQTPPAFSAVRTGGQRAYERARRGESVELEPRPVEVYAIELLELCLPSFRIRLECSKGTYVRSLVAEVGRQLGCGAALSALRRVRAGPFRLSQAVSLQKVEEDGPEILISVDQALSQLPALEVTAEEANGIRQGQPLPEGAGGETISPMRLRSQGKLVALGEVRDGRVWPKRVFALEEPAHVDKPADMEEDAPVK